MSSSPLVSHQALTHKQRPELHVTAEIGVLEAPAGAVVANGNLHVFHQFRPHRSAGARWAHQIASEVPYDWDVCDDVLVPEGDELDVLAGSSVPLSANPDHSPEDETAVELFFVTSTPRSELSDTADRNQLLGNYIHHGHRGDRAFTIQRARIDDISDLLDVSDDPSRPDERVRRLGPIDIDDSAYPISDLATPCVLWDNGSWLMLALDLENDTDAKIVVLRSADRQHWIVEGPLFLSDESGVPDQRAFAPRIVTMPDEADGQPRHVLFVTYPRSENDEGGNDELTGYCVGELEGTTFTVTTPFTVLDHGHDFSRPRVLQANSPVLLGLVGAHPDYDGQWANSLTSPRYLSLVNGHLFQDIVGTPRAVKGYSERALIWTGQLNVAKGSVTVTILNRNGDAVVTVSHAASSVSVSRNDGDTVTAAAHDSDSATLTIFVDGPMCEVFADGGATSLTSAIPARVPVNSVKVEVAGGAEIINSMVTVGQDLLRARAGLDSPEDQERFMAEALVADREVAEGLADLDDFDATS